MRKEYTTNEMFRKLFLEQKCSQVQFSLLIGLDKNSIHDWLKSKNQMKFNKLEEIAKKLNKKITIKLES